MANQEHFEMLRQGVDVWNRWREEHPEVERPDLSGADLLWADLSGANLSTAELTGADISRCILIEANLFMARLLWADLSTADLRAANLREADLRYANLSGANLSRANLREADLEQANLIRTNIEESILTGCHIYGISVWSLQGTPKDQSNLIITEDGEPVVTVDDLEVAQFIHLLLNHQKLRNVLNSVTERGVLLLGRFGGGGLAVLHAIADKLRASSYLPIIFDFDKPTDRNYTETVKTLAGLSRFVIVDLSGPSVPQELYATVPHYKIPFVPILEHGSHPYSMFADLLEYPWVLQPIVTYQSIGQLIEFLPEKVIAPAEERAKARQALRHQFFDPA